MLTDFIKNKGSFSWTPSIALEAGDDYTFHIISDADKQHIDISPPFTIKRAAIKRQDDQSSFMSGFAPATTAAAATPTPSTTLLIFSSTTVQTATVTVPNSSAATSAPTVATDSPIATPSQAATETSNTNGLSTGAAIGIGVGATLLVLLLLALLVFFILRRRRQKRQQPPVFNSSSSGAAELDTGKSAVPKVADLGMGGDWKAGKTSELDSEIAKPQMAELRALPPLGPEEYDELERRRRAVELQGQSTGAVRPAELQGQTHPRAELEALRANSRNVHELGGYDIISSVQPAYHR